MTPTEIRSLVGQAGFHAAIAGLDERRKRAGAHSVPYALSAFAAVQAREFAHADRFYRMQLVLSPGDLASYYNFANNLTRQSKNVAGICAYRRAILDHSLRFQVSHNLARAHLAQGEYETAARHIKVAHALAPLDANVGADAYVILAHCRRFREAETVARRTLLASPGQLTAISNYSLAACDTRRAGEARKMAAIAERVCGGDESILKNCGVVHLYLFDFDRGLPLWRHRTHPKPAIVDPAGRAVAAYDGQDLSGRNVVVYGEQGIGDHLLFALALHRLCDLCRSVTFVIGDRILDILQRSFPRVGFVRESEFAASGGRIPASADVKLAIGDLPLVTGLLVDGKPVFPWFTGDRTRIADLRLALQERYGAGPFVGVAWRSKSPRDGAMRSIPIPAFAKVNFPTKAVLVNLQYESSADEVGLLQAATGREAITIESIDLYQDLFEVCNLISALDHVVTAANINTILSGICGTDATLLQPYRPFWYWGVAGDRSPWFPRSRILRQRCELEPWEAVLARVDLAGCRPRGIVSPLLAQQLSASQAAAELSPQALSPP